MLRYQRYTVFGSLWDCQAVKHNMFAKPPRLTRQATSTVWFTWIALWFVEGGQSQAHCWLQRPWTAGWVHRREKSVICSPPPNFLRRAASRCALINDHSRWTLGSSHLPAFCNWTTILNGAIWFPKYRSSMQYRTPRPSQAPCMLCKYSFRESDAVIVPLICAVRRGAGWVEVDGVGGWGPFFVPKQRNASKVPVQHRMGHG